MSAVPPGPAGPVPVGPPFGPVPPPRRLVRWGIGDVALVWLAGLLGAIVAGSVLVAARGVHHTETDALDLAVTVPAQFLPMLGVAWLVARGKGLGSLRRDFGFVVRWRDWPWLFAGVGLQVASTLVLAPISMLSDTEQEVVSKLSESRHGPELVLAVLGVLILAPLVEELVFRGILLRALGRRVPLPAAVAISAGVFGLAHLLDPGAAVVLSPLLLLGVISAVRAVRTGELSQSIMLHGGFNLLTSVVIVTGMIHVR